VGRPRHARSLSCSSSQLMPRLQVSPLPAGLPEPMKVAAEGSHYALYALMIGMPLIGWGMLSAAAYPVVLFRGWHLPAILPQSDSLHTLLWFAHFYLAFAFFALVLLHVAAALFHALVRRDWRV
jgi:cytochrome b561